MAQSVIINTVTYPDVPSVEIPKSPSGTATFYDVSDATLASGASLLKDVTAYGRDGTKYTGQIESRSGSDLTASGDTVTVPAGSYSEQATKAVASGSATAPATISGSSASISTGTNTLTLTKSVSVTPVVSAGYVGSGTAGTSSVSLTASVTTKSSATFTPGTSNQVIQSGTYLTGSQTILGDANLIGANIKAGVSLFNGAIVGTLSSVAVSQDSTTKVLSIS